MNRILITGGAGFVGSRLARQLMRQGVEVALFDLPEPQDPVERWWRKKRLERMPTPPHLVCGDLARKEEITSAVRDFRPDVIVHLAAVADAKACQNDPDRAYEVNVIGTGHVLRAAVEAGTVRRIVFVSTSFVYGDFDYVPADEAHPIRPAGVYGRTKLEAENLVFEQADKAGIEPVVVRTSAVYGYGDHHRRVVNRFVQSAVRGEPLTVVDSGDERLDFSYVDDVASGLALCALRSEAAGEVFNITRGEGRTVGELARIVQRLIPAAVVQYESPPPDLRRPRRGALDIEKARRLLEYQPGFSLEKGVAAFLEDIKKQGLP